MFSSASSATIRPVRATDLPSLIAIIDSTGLFPGEMLPDMLSGYLAGRSNDALWFTLEDPADRRPMAVAYVAPERMTVGTYNLHLIAVHASQQGRGVGGALLTHVERAVASQEGRVLLVETSGLPAFTRTRAFYAQRGYTEEARIRAFYAAGEDKVVYWKAIVEPAAV